MRTAMAWAIQSPAVFGLPKLNMWDGSTHSLLVVGSRGAWRCPFYGQ
jgi:hypothetical protein